MHDGAKKKHIFYIADFKLGHDEELIDLHYKVKVQTHFAGLTVVRFMEDELTDAYFQGFDDACNALELIMAEDDEEDDDCSFPSDDGEPPEIIH
jgi:hypothetical protein